MTQLFLLLTLVIGVSCTGKSNTEELHVARSPVAFSKFINQKKMPKNPNLTIDKSLINEEYPIEIALYNDGKFFYSLPNLQDGHGTWKYVDGVIKLYSKLSLFDMHIDVYGSNSDISNITVAFTDRRGFKTLRMDNNNIAP